MCSIKAPWYNLKVFSGKPAQGRLLTSSLGCTSYFLVMFGYPQHSTELFRLHYKMAAPDVNMSLSCDHMAPGDWLKAVAVESIEPVPWDPYFTICKKPGIQNWGKISSLYIYLQIIVAFTLTDVLSNVLPQHVYTKSNTTHEPVQHTVNDVCKEHSSLYTWLNTEFLKGVVCLHVTVCLLCLWLLQISWH